MNTVGTDRATTMVPGSCTDEENHSSASSPSSNPSPAPNPLRPEDVLLPSSSSAASTGTSTITSLHQSGQQRQEGSGGVVQIQQQYGSIRGRHLTIQSPAGSGGATIKKGSLLFVERPLLFQPSLENDNYQRMAITCQYCYAFIGGPNFALSYRFRNTRKQQAHHDQEQEQGERDEDENNSKATTTPATASATSTLEDESKPAAASSQITDPTKEKYGGNEGDDDDILNDNNDDDYTIVYCRSNCGYKYCSQYCETMAWQQYHQFLCTGLCTTYTEPLIQFKQYAIENNEILLLVAEWWVKEHLLMNHNETSTDTTSNKGAISSGSSSSCITPTSSSSSVNNQYPTTTNATAIISSPSPYQDFQMEPWWDVITLGQLQQQEQQSELPLLSKPGGFVETISLQHTTHQICQHAAILLNQVWENDRNKNHGHRPFVIPNITPLDIAKRIGSCEQNAIGVRQRHPLCRTIFHRPVRESSHSYIIQCLQEADFIETNTITIINENDGVAVNQEQDDEEEENDDNQDDGDNKNKPLLLNSNIIMDSKDASGSLVTLKNDAPLSEECEYSVDEIADFLSSLFLDEEGSVRDVAKTAANGVTTSSEKDQKQTTKDECQQERDGQGDDFDYIFPPLDGTAMYALACKMNHSCNPNVIALYKRTGWGRYHPLTLFCCALRDIVPGEELTISYIDKSQPTKIRQAALANYGFICQCSRCIELEESDCDVQNTPLSQGPMNAMDMFGTDDVDDAAASDDGYDDKDGNDNDKDAQFEQGLAIDAETKLQQRLERLDSVSNYSMFGATPSSYVSLVAAFVAQMTTSLAAIQPVDDSIRRLLRECSNALVERDFAMCKIVGRDLESLLYSSLRRDSGWPSVGYRHAYWCSAVTAAVGYSHECNFLTSLRLLDRALILGLPRDDDRVWRLYEHVESHSNEMARGRCPYISTFDRMIPDYRMSTSVRSSLTGALPALLQHLVDECSDNALPADVFQRLYVSMYKPIVLRGYALDWPAIDKWRDLGFFLWHHGHRTIPVESGSMMTGTMTEKLMEMRAFIQYILMSGTGLEYWSLNDAVTRESQVAYLAQHPLLTQIPSLYDDIKRRPSLLSIAGEPSHVYIWMGTGGTRTPLHFDSYDNLFVQLVGAKYVRLYAATETPSLYVSTKSIYGLQGNLSEVDCEREDYTIHPRVKTARYTETILLPGDCLFIPSRTWHYVRSLTTSISVNFWF